MQFKSILLDTGYSLLVCAIASIGCHSPVDNRGTESKTTAGPSPASVITMTRKETAMVRITSPAFAHDADIPRKYTCEGDDVAPPLSFEDVPASTKSLALIVDDPDAPDPAAPKRVWVHWVVFNIPPSTRGLPEGGRLPDGTREGVNDWNKTGYGGPCPPIGKHRYFHKLYALDTVLDLERPSKRDLEAAMKGHVLAHGELVGKYQKGR